MVDKLEDVLAELNVDEEVTADEKDVVTPEQTQEDQEEDVVEQTEETTEQTEKDTEVEEEDDELKEEEEEETKIPENLDDIKQKVVVDGEEQEVTIKELRDAYQLKQYSHKVINDAKKFSEKVNKIAERINDPNQAGALLEELHGREYLIKQAEALLIDHYRLQELQKTNPQEYQQKIRLQQEETRIRQEGEKLKQDQNAVYQAQVEAEKTKLEATLPGMFEKAGLSYNDAAKRDVHNEANELIKQIQQQYGEQQDIDFDKVLEFSIIQVKQKYDNLIQEYQKKQPERDLKKTEKKFDETTKIKQKPKVSTPNKNTDTRSKVYTVSDWERDVDKKFGR